MTGRLVQHVHSQHLGFKSVIAESTSTCCGDGVTVEWFETVLETHAKFLATEVKPQVGEDSRDEVRKFVVRKAGRVGENRAVMEVEQRRLEMEVGMRRQQMIQAARKHSRARIAPEVRIRKQMTG